MLSLLVSSQRWSQFTDSTKEKISNFQAFLEVSYWQEMSRFIDDLCTSNFPVFNASRS